MKKNRKLIIGIVAAAVLLVSVGAAVFFAQAGSGEIMDTAAKRAGKPDPNAFYIEPDLTALAGELNGSPETQAAAKAAFDTINAYRAGNGLAAYKWSNGLEQAAGVRAVEASQVWAHTRPNGTDYYTVNEAIVYGENLAKGYSTSESVVQGWIDSPPHKANILDGEFRTAGISIHMVGGQWYWANEFGY